MTRRIACAVLGLIAVSGSAFAHHSFAGEFDNTVAVNVQGVITSVEMINPHSFIFVNVTTNGVVERWALEGPNPFQVKRRGLDLAMFKVGDKLGACGYLAKSDVVTTRPEPGTDHAARKLQAAVLVLPNGDKLLWNNYRQEKCGLDVEFSR